MAETVRLEVWVRDMPSVLLLVVRLEQLLGDMRVGASPFAEELETILETFSRSLPDGGGPDDGR